MKKFVAMLCVVMMVVGLCGCGAVEMVKERIAEPKITVAPEASEEPEEPAIEETNASGADVASGVWEMTGYYMVEEDTFLPKDSYDYSIFECQLFGEREGVQYGNYTMTYSLAGSRESAFCGQYAYLGNYAGVETFFVIENGKIFGVDTEAGTMMLDMSEGEYNYYMVFEKADVV